MVYNPALDDETVPDTDLPGVVAGHNQTLQDQESFRRVVEDQALAERGVDLADSMRTCEALRAKVVPPGTRIGEHVVRASLGVGGMADVLLATRRLPDGDEQTVVIKRILPQLIDDPRIVQMFLREARLAMRLQHPQIAQVHELGQVDGAYYIVMEHIDGMTLHRMARRMWMEGRALPIPMILSAIADAAQALEFAHNLRGEDGARVGLVHRDVSPDNIMLNGAGRVKLLDFGVASTMNATRLTVAGELKGKIPFMAPELFTGKEVDHRVDIYALGVCLMWMLTGQRPFSGSTSMALMRAVVSTPPPAPRSLNHAVPKDVDALVLRLLAKDPDQRPPSAAAVAEELLAIAPRDHRRLREFAGLVRDIPDRDVGLPLAADFLASRPDPAPAPADATGPQHPMDTMDDVEFDGPTTVAPSLHAAAQARGASPAIVPHARTLHVAYAVMGVSFLILVLALVFLWMS